MGKTTLDQVYTDPLEKLEAADDDILVSIFYELRNIRMLLQIALNEEIKEDDFRGEEEVE